MSTTLFSVSRTNQGPLTGMSHASFALLLFVSLIIFSCNDEGTLDTPIPPGDEEGILYDIAGTQGVAGGIGDEGPAVSCLLYWPCDVTATPNGEILVVDWHNYRIRKITPDGIIHSFIGSGIPGDGVSGPGPTVDLYGPTDVKIGPDGNYYVADSYNWKIKVFDSVTLECSVMVGTDIRGFRGDGGPATVARLDRPGSLVFDTAGNMYISDQGNSRIRKVDAQTDTITTFAGGIRGYVDGVGEAAQFAFPGCECLIIQERGAAIAISPYDENIYVADTDNHRIRKINIATRMVTTIAGTGDPGYSGDGGSALEAQLNFPTDLAVSSSGDLYIADSHNHVIRKIDAAGIITTVAGTGVAGLSPNGTPATSANLYGSQGITFDNETNTLYIADTYNHQVKKVKLPR